MKNICEEREIGVLVVDDSAFMRTALTRILASEAGIKVLGTAGNGSEALQKIRALDPDVVTLDVEMPGINGLETLHSIMSNSPRPVIMVSCSTEKDAEVTFNALAAGAFDYVPKQLSPASLDIFHIREDLVAKVKAAAQSRPRTAPRKRPAGSEIHGAADFALVPAVIAIGTSTGGPKALQDVLPALPRELPVPLLIVQHMPVGFTTPFANRLHSMCALDVREARNRERIEAGTAYIAPAGLHMTIERGIDSSPVAALTSEPANCLHIPSVDILMESVARHFGSLAMGIIMTGMGSDGALGMKAIYRAGGITIGQDEASSVVYGMPKACAELGVVQRVVPLSEIPGEILRATRCRKRAAFAGA